MKKIKLKKTLCKKLYLRNKVHNLIWFEIINVLGPALEDHNTSIVLKNLSFDDKNLNILFRLGSNCHNCSSIENTKNNVTNYISELLNENNIYTFNINYE